jgi:peptide deformylase
MSVLKIARMGHPVLNQVAEPVSDPTHPEVRRLVADMMETLDDIGGLGLAAPQVHVPRRLVIFHVPGEEDERGPLTVLINPVIEPLTDAMDMGWEGCLSVPGLRGDVPRHTRIRYRGVTLGGDEIDREAEGYHARVVQHECDHLDGVLYPQRMTDLRRLVFETEMRRFLMAERLAQEAAREAVAATPVAEDAAE